MSTPAAGADRVRRAMAEVPRAGFLPRVERPFAGLDQPLPIGEGQTNSQPSTVRQMLELLDVRPGDRVLDVGAGSGWTTGLLGWLVGPTGSVLGLELVPTLARTGAANLSRCGMPHARLEPARPDRLGSPDDGPFDRILVSAGATSIPEELVEQLAPGGTMVCPVQGRMLRLRLRPGGEREEEWSGYYRFVPLITGGS